MISVSPLHDDKKEEFCKLFKRYYEELGCDDDCDHLLSEYVLPDLICGLLNIDILCEEGDAVGFAIYQRDEIENDWNLKEGWGDIREIYVLPEHRRQGEGKFLLFTAEMKLREAGAKKCYCLPAEGSVPFFTACGYTRSEEFNEDLNCYVYEKLSLINGCKKGE